MLLSIISVVAVFGLIVAIHEWGHMMAAKLCGVAVPNFALGMGPSLWRRAWRGTRYHICAVPIGGFVTIAGMEGDDPLNARQQESLRPLPEGPQKKWQDINGFQRAFILAAGPLMNFVLAVIVIFAMGLLGFPHDAVMITSVREDTPAAQAGLAAGDLITAIDGHRVTKAGQFAAIVQANKDQPVELRFERGGAEQGLEITPRSIEGFNENLASIGVGLQQVAYSTSVISLVSPGGAGDKARLRGGDQVVEFNGQPVSNGMQVLLGLPGVDTDGNPVDTEGRPLSPGGAPHSLVVARGAEMLSVSLPADTSMLSLGVAFKPRLERVPFLESLRRSVEQVEAVAAATVWSLRLAFTPAGLSSISGPVGITRMISQSAHSGLYELLEMVMIINLSLGFFNLLPIPALDGGRMVFVALAGLGLRISEKREALVHAVSMMILLGLIALVSLKDLWNVFGR